MRLIHSTFFITCIVLVFFTACHPYMDYEKACGSNSDLRISSRQVCGWQGFQDSMLIDKNKILYYNSCAPGVLPKQYPITCAEWDSLVNTIDLPLFTTLGYESCGICADGCDISIGIKTDTSFHKVTFAGALQAIKMLADKIAKRRLNYMRITCGQ